MTVPKLAAYDVIVFDLDDTLYSEKDYVNSGYQAISRQIANLYGIDFEAAIANNIQQQNVLRSALLEVGLDEILLPQLIQIYRYHEPKIALFPKVSEILNTLKQCNKPMYLITDGRALTQRLKINALGIASYFEKIYISEEQGYEKPALHSFNAISEIESGKRIVYIADNPKKDFIAPKALGWNAIGVKHIHTRVHPMVIKQEPDIWLLTIDQLLTE